MTAPDVTAGDALREALVAEFGVRFQPRSGMSERAVERLADAVLALPELRALIAERDELRATVRDVRAALDQWGDDLTVAQVRALRRGLDGTR